MKIILAFLFLTFSCQLVLAQNTHDEKAEAVVKKAIQRMGGEKYLQIKSSVGRGFYTQIGERASGVPSQFVDYIVFPDKERTEFKSPAGRTIQTNVGETGWLYDGAAKTISDQTPEQVANFKQGIRTSLDNLLRGGWRKENAKLEFVGRREASLGKRNEVVRLTYADGFSIEFEFDARDGTPMKSIYKRKSVESEDLKEEDRYAQFVEVSGLFAPFIIDHYTNGKQTSRINFQTIEFNTPVADALFTKPENAKKIK